MKNYNLLRSAICATLPLLIFIQNIYAQADKASYAENMKNAKTLKIVGISSMAAGTGLILWSASNNDVPVKDAFEYKEKESFDWQLTAGCFLLGGGILTTVLGIADGAKAKKMNQNRKVGFLPKAPPARIIGSAGIPQRGVTINVPIGK